VPCKEYLTKKECQFGGHCFYAHLDEEGNDIRQQQLQVSFLHSVMYVLTLYFMHEYCILYSLYDDNGKNSFCMCSCM
jgi:hypothetical protein